MDIYIYIPGPSTRGQQNSRNTTGKLCLVLTHTVTFPASNLAGSWTDRLMDLDTHTHTLRHTHTVYALHKVVAMPHSET